MGAIRWGPFLRAERIRRLSVSAEGSTTYLTEERIQGPLSPLVHRLYGRHIQRGPEGGALGLKAYVEEKSVKKKDNLKQQVASLSSGEKQDATC